MIVIGIDPGLTGAIGMVSHDGQYVAVHDIPTMERMAAKGTVKRQVNGAALGDLLKELTRDFDTNEVHVFFETPIAFPGQNVSTIAAAFLTAGIIEGVVSAQRYRHTPVTPAVWKKAMKLSASKEQGRAMAIRLFPDAPLSRMKDHNRAEALLIAKYGHQEVA